MPSLMNKATNGYKKDLLLSLTIIPENSAVAMMGEKPDHSNLGANKILEMVANAITMAVNNKSFLFNFISYYLGSKNKFKK